MWWDLYALEGMLEECGWSNMSKFVCHMSDFLMLFIFLLAGLWRSQAVWQVGEDFGLQVYSFQLASQAHVYNISCISVTVSSRALNSKSTVFPLGSSRWPARYDQWWECKFIAEGIIDQGGGFRDSLADMSEELCPSSAECSMPLPFFCRTSNQVMTHHQHAD